MNNIFNGLLTAMVTPFKEGKPDLPAFERMLEYQIAGRVDGVVIAGSTGEGASLTFDEYRELVEVAVDGAKKRLYVIAGIPGISTQSALNQAQEAQKLGADGLMCAIPPYVRPTQRGIYEHFRAVHDATNLPIILYTVPKRIGADFTDETIINLSRLPRIAALKDASGDINRPLKLSGKIKENFNLLVGNDEETISYNANGGRGCVSVASNIAPKLCKKLQLLCSLNNFKEALEIQRRLFPFYMTVFVESNPIPIKYALHFAGFCANELRLPLTPLGREYMSQIETKVEEVLRAELNADGDE